ncbi:hypothetical protein ACI48D_02915 [Massilia sp. LXY-6]|uniref:hypothetical protein n=1 Tax=Massilia sp. LXY-6 TaxID=3379823 RepID=UPI003EE0C920
MMRLRQSARRALAAMMVLGLASIVAACHHHDDDRDNGQGQSPPAGGTTNPPVATDAFVTYVAQVVATQDETSEPASTEGVTVTAPDSAEPVPLPGS